MRNENSSARTNLQIEIVAALKKDDHHCIGAHREQHVIHRRHDVARREFGHRRVAPPTPQAVVRGREFELKIQLMTSFRIHTDTA